MRKTLPQLLSPVTHQSSIVESVTHNCVIRSIGRLGSPVVTTW